jgi:hypothetical protein
MAFTDTNVFYELLIRGNDEGAVQGAHIQFRRIIRNDGVIIFDQPGPAVPVSLTDEEGKLKLEEVLGDTLSESLVRLGEQDDALAEKDAMIADLNARIWELEHPVSRNAIEEGQEAPVAEEAAAPAAEDTATPAAE